MNPWLGRFVLLVYGVMLFAGGLMGWRKAKSKPSLIAGSISGTLAIAFAVISHFQPKIGFWGGAALGVAMLAFFAPRYLKTKKMMPAGLMAIASFLIVALLVIQMLSIALDTPAVVPELGR